MRWFSGKRLLWKATTAVSLVASFSAGHYFGWPFWLAVTIWIAASVASNLLIYRYPRARYRRRWAKASSYKRHSSGQNDWRLYGLAALLMVGTFCVVFFWPSDRYTEAATLISPAPSPSFSCRVSSVHDGDTLRCSDGTRVRLNAVSAREIDETCSPGHPCPAASGASAQEALERMALGKLLNCEATGTSYDRVTAWCWTPDRTELSCAMVEGGYALRWARYDPDGRLCR